MKKPTHYLEWYNSSGGVKVGECKKIHKNFNTIYIHHLFDIFLKKPIHIIIYKHIDFTRKMVTNSLRYCMVLTEGSKNTTIFDMLHLQKRMVTPFLPF